MWNAGNRGGGNRIGRGRCGTRYERLAARVKYEGRIETGDRRGLHAFISHCTSLMYTVHSGYFCAKKTREAPSR